MLDYDGTLLAQSSINPKPNEDVLAVLRALTADERNTVFIVSGRGRAELGAWFQSVVSIVQRKTKGICWSLALGGVLEDDRFGPVRIQSTQSSLKCAGACHCRSSWLRAARECRIL